MTVAGADPSSHASTKHESSRCWHLSRVHKGHDYGGLAPRHGPSATRHATMPRYRGRYTHPRCPLPSSASPPRPRHGKSPRYCLRAFVLSQRLHLVSIVCDVSVGRRRGLSGDCFSARKHRPVGLRPAASLFSLCILPFSWCTWLFLGRSSSRAIPGVFRVPDATCDGFLPRNRVETDEGCRHVGRRR
jgi:hypothetical protein